MSSDEPPPHPAPSRALALLVAVLALIGIAMAIAGADTTVTDATGAAPIVDDASRQDPAQVEHAAPDAVDQGRAPGLDASTRTEGAPCSMGDRAPRFGDGCSPPTLRGPPSA